MSNELISVIMPTYRQERFVRDAVDSILRQTYTPLEIIISDDCSPDDTYSILKAMLENYEGPHQVRLSRNSVNQGLISQINKLMSLSQGNFIVAAAGDDISLPNRVEKIAHAFDESQRKTFSIYSGRYIIDSDNNILRTETTHPDLTTLSLDWYARNYAGVGGSTQAWHRSVFDIFGPLPPELGGEDIVIPFRAALLGNVGYIAEPLVMYREHENNLHKETKLPTSYRYYRNYRAVYETRLKDLQTFEHRFPGGIKELDEYFAICRNRITEAEYGERYIASQGLSKITASVRAFLAGVSFSKILRWYLIEYTPWLFEARRRYAIARTSRNR